MHVVSPHWQGCNDMLWCPPSTAGKSTGFLSRAAQRQGSVMHPQSSSRKRDKEFFTHIIKLFQN